MAIKISVISCSIRPKGLEITQKCLSSQTFQDFEWLVELSTIKKTGSDLNAALNRGLKRAKGELIVFLQDYIQIKQSGLQRFWDAYQKYSSCAFTAPVGKVNSFGDKPKWDWRKKKKKYEKLNWAEWEIDWASCPMRYLEHIGGFDESLDEFWGFDNCVGGKKLELADCAIRCLPDNPAIAIDHNKFIDHPYQERRNPTFYNNLIRKYEMGYKKNYLN